MRTKITDIPALYSYTGLDEYQVFIETLTHEQLQQVKRWRNPPSYLLHLSRGTTLNSEDMYYIKVAAADPTLKPDTLTLLYDYGLLFPNPEAVLQVLIHPNFPSQALSKVVTIWQERVWESIDGYTEMLTAFALAHPALENARETIRTVLHSFPKNARTQWGNSRDIFSYGVRVRGRQQARAPQSELLLTVITDPNVPSRPEVLEELYLWGWGNTETDHEGEISYHFENIRVVERVLGHPNCPSELPLSLLYLWKTVENADAYIHSYEQEFVKDLLIQKLVDPDCSPDFLQEACWVKDKDIRRLIAEHPNCPDEVRVVVVLSEEL